MGGYLPSISASFMPTLSPCADAVSSATGELGVLLLSSTAVADDSLNTSKWLKVKREYTG